MALLTDNTTEVTSYADTEAINTTDAVVDGFGWYWQNMLYNSTFPITSTGGGVTTALTGWALSDAATILHVNSSTGKMRFNASASGSYNETATTFMPGSTNSTTLAGISSMQVANLDTQEGPRDPSKRL